jgi:diphthine-ammonia ligase
VIDEDKSTVIPSGAGAAYMRISGAQLEPISFATGDISDLRMPPLLEDRLKILLETLIHDAEREDVRVDGGGSIGETSNSTALPGEVFLADLVGDGATPADQTKAIMEQAKLSLQSQEHSMEDVAYTSIILREMADFASVNAVYGSYFQHPNPPARVTIACAAVLPQDKDVMISLTSVMHRESSSRRGLHIQSRSYWAPANIGPYSQAISVPLNRDSEDDNGSLVYIAGQIPLVPSTMELPTPQERGQDDPFALQTILALQHFVRIGRVMQVRRWTSAIVFITATSPEEARIRSNIAHQAWKGVHRVEALNTDSSTSEEESDSFDVWDVKFGNARQYSHQSSLSQLSLQDTIQTGETPSLHIIQVDCLPRGANIEWVTYGLTADSSVSPELRHFDRLTRTFKQQVTSTVR